MESDEHLVIACVRGNEMAFEQLVKLHVDDAYAFALRLTGSQSDAEDIVQESFLRVWKHLRRFDARKARFKTWLMHIVRNAAFDHLRRKKMIPFSRFEDEDGGNEFADSIADDMPLPEEITAKKHDAKVLEHALEQLSPTHREIVLLYHQSDFSFEEIASIAGQSKNTIKSRYRRAIQALRATLLSK